jgi:hypothetical protein
MELVILATTEQKNALEGTYNDGCILKFIEDANDNWVVNTRVIEDGQFLEIRKQLELLPKIEYQPKIINL